MTVKAIKKEGHNRLQVSKIDPCMGCNYFKKCATEKMACYVMRVWLGANRIEDDKPKIPSHEYYRQIYGDK